MRVNFFLPQGTHTQKTANLWPRCVLVLLKLLAGCLIDLAEFQLVAADSEIYHSFVSKAFTVCQYCS